MTSSPFLRETVAAIEALLVRACPGVERPGLLVALSGGPDSTALLLAAVAWRERTGGALAAAHLNHRLRGEVSDRDESACAALCAAHDVRLVLRAADPRALARERGCGLEEAGRHLRRRFLASVLDAEPDLHAAATGHHRDDQTETVLMRLLRGTGPDGLRGIRPVSGRIIHPLLGVGRAEIQAFLAGVGQTWRFDTTNVDGDNLRARLRRELLPVARGLFGAGCDEAPARLAALLDDDLGLLERLTDAAAAACAAGDDLRADGLAALDPALARRVVRRWLAPDPDDDAPAPTLERVHVAAVLDLLAEGASGRGVDLPGGVRVVREFGLLHRVGADAAAGLRRAEDYRILVRRDPPTAPGAPEAADDAPGHGDPGDEATWSLRCPAAALQGNLRVRNWRRGDRIGAFGLDGTRKLSDLFRDSRLPASARSGVLVVEDDAGILWVVGLARAERTRLLPTGGPTVTLTVARRMHPPNRGKDT